MPHIRSRLIPLARAVSLLVLSIHYIQLYIFSLSFFLVSITSSGPEVINPDAIKINTVMSRRIKLNEHRRKDILINKKPSCGVVVDCHRHLRVAIRVDSGVSRDRADRGIRGG